MRTHYRVKIALLAAGIVIYCSVSLSAAGPRPASGPSVVSLEECIRTAEGSSIPLQVAREQIILGRLKRLEARRAFFPQLTLSWDETKGIQSAGKTEALEYGIEGKQPAFHSGELTYRLAQANANLKAADKNYDNVKSGLYYEVSEAYYLFVKAKKSLEFGKALYEDIKPFSEMARKKHDKGLIPDIEYLNAESKINQIYFKNMSAESNFELARLGLEQKLNIEESGSIDIALDLDPKKVDKDMETCLSLAMRHRPDLKISELNVKSAEYGEKVEKAKEMPRIDLAGHYKKSDEVYTKQAGGLESKLDTKIKWYAGLEASMPFFGSTGKYSLYKRKDPATLSTFTAGTAGTESKGTSWELGLFDDLQQFSATKEAEVQSIYAAEELNKTRKKVVVEVKEAFYEYKKAHVQLEAARIQREFHEKEVKILKLKHETGDNELSELLGAFGNLMDSNESYFEAEKNLYTSIAALNKAIGLDGYF